MDKTRLEELARILVDSALCVHRALGPGLLESAYQRCLAFELLSRGLKVRTEVAVPLHYRGEKIDTGFRIDLLIEDSIIVENKAVDRLLPIHEAQLLTFLKITGCRLGFLLNWNERLIKNGIKRMVLNLEEPPNRTSSKQEYP